MLTFSTFCILIPAFIWQGYGVYSPTCEEQPHAKNNHLQSATTLENHQGILH